MHRGFDSYSLRPVSDLPAPFRSIFNFRYFNSLQSECFPACFLSDVCMVISAPTGSGKTVLFELCILRLLSKFLSADGRFLHVKGTLKTIYIAPSKALVQEKLRDWNKKLGQLGVVCLELTSDSGTSSRKNIQEADIILTTPEKFDAVTRYSIKDGGLSFFSDIAVLLIDEVHILNDPRGASLEAVVSRMKMLSRRPEMKTCPLASIRFIAVSATIPNLQDAAEWLMVPLPGMKRFGEEMRPVKLDTKVFGYAAAKNDFLFEKRLQNYIFEIIMQFSRGKSALIFCSTRKGAQEAAQRISQSAMTFGHSNPFVKTREQYERLREASSAFSDKQMQSWIISGVGYHHGGLCLKDRYLVENLFLSGDIQILCTTNTLAQGVNLPAHTVVIKSTQHFNKEKGLYMEYDRSTILQMCGRAGRPPFDDTGLVIIMTRRETVHLYENLLNGCEMVESQLLGCMTEHLTAEIVQLTIPDIAQAIEWLKCSYLYVRMKKNPENYGVRETCRDRVESYMQEVCVQKVNELSRTQMIETDEDGFLLKPLEPGKLMTKYYLKFNTMKNIMQTDLNCSLEYLLHIVCRAEELSWIQLRRNEKKLLNDINMDKDGRLRFHVVGDKGKRKKRIQTREEKIFVLANDCLTGDPLIHDLSISQDINSVCSNGCRIAKCMKEYFIYNNSYRGALNSMLLAKSLHQKLWDDSPFLLKQLPGIGMVTAKALRSMGLISFDSLAEADPRKIEIVTGRKYPFGNSIKGSLLSLPPRIEMRLEELETSKQGKAKLAITLTRLSQVQSVRWHYADMVVGLEEDNRIIYHKKLRVDEFSSPYTTTVFLPTSGQGKLTVKAHLIFEEYLGIDLLQTLLVAGETDPASTSKHGRKMESSSCVIQDYTIKDGPGNESTFEAQNLDNTITTKIDSMPSFNLLDEELEAVLNGIEAEDDCQVIGEQTVFDLIHQKSKDFPIVRTSDGIQSPLSEASKLTISTIHEKQLQFQGMTEFSAERRTKRKLSEIIASLLPEARDSKHSKSLTNEDPHYIQLPASRRIDTINILDEEGDFPQVEDNATRRREDEIFGHIRRKSKNFPVIHKPNVDDECIILTEECFSHRPLGQSSVARNTSSTVNSSKSTVEDLIILDSSPSEMETDASSDMKDWNEKEVVSSRRNSAVRKSLDHSTEILTNDSQVPSIRRPALSWSSLHNDFQLQHSGDTMCSNQQPQSAGAATESCSMAFADENRKGDFQLQCPDDIMPYNQGNQQPQSTGAATECCSMAFAAENRKGDFQLQRPDDIMPCNQGNQQPQSAGAATESCSMAIAAENRKGDFQLQRPDDIMPCNQGNQQPQSAGAATESCSMAIAAENRKGDFQLQRPDDIMPYNQGNQQPQSAGAATESCSMAIAAETRKVDSFLGFKSVFSFL